MRFDLIRFVRTHREIKQNIVANFFSQKAALTQIIASDGTKAILTGSNLLLDLLVRRNFGWILILNKTLDERKTKKSGL